MPSEMPVRTQFGSWNNFIKSSGHQIYIPIPPGRPQGSKNKIHKRIVSHGYIHLFEPKHPQAMKNGYVREHRKIMSEHIGRTLKPNENVHHLNGNKKDNRLENLKLMSRGKHTKIHNPAKKNKFENPKLLK